MLTKKCGPFENQELLTNSEDPWGQGQPGCKKALKKQLKQESKADLFNSVKGQPSLALHCWCVAYDSGTACPSCSGENTDEEMEEKRKKDKKCVFLCRQTEVKMTDIKHKNKLNR